MASGIRRNFKRSEAVAKSEFYVNSTYKVLHNTLDRVLILQLFLLGWNMNTVQVCWKNASY